MKESYLFDMSFNNLIFSDRNKAYGAYVLRKTYSRNITVAALLGIAIFSVVVITPTLKTILNGSTTETQTAPDLPKTDDRTVTILPPPEPPKPLMNETVPVQLVKEKVAKQKFTKIKVVPNEVDTPEDVPSQEDFETAEISNITQEGILPETPTTKVETDAPVGLGSGTATHTEPYIVVEEMPQFGKGEADLLAYLGKNIRYPSKARNAGIEGLVVITFVVTAAGDVQDIQVVKGLGYGTEEEAMRVVKAMPKWKPGKQNGRSVPVRYTLPIRLQIEN